jgi:AcrR family transcriptional regulator
MPKIVNHEEYRRELLKKCFYLFCRKGYAKVTMREIAIETGVSTGAIYHYFSKKQNILEEMFKYIVETNVEEYLSRVKRIKTGSLEERLYILIDFVIDFEKHYKNILLLVIDLFRIYGSDETEKIISGFSKYYIDTMAKQLNLPDQFAQPLFIYIVGLIFQSLLIPSQTSFSENMSGLKNILKAVVLKSDKLDADSNMVLFNTLLERNR